MSTHAAEHDTAAATPDADADSFDGFYRAHLDRIYRALALTLGNDTLAREAADEAMARAYARWGRVRDLDNPAAWVYRVGFNWATSWWRKVRRERPALADSREPAVAGPDADAIAARTALERLPIAQRAVVVCRVLLDLSTADTAAVLKVSEGTVKSRLSRGLDGLRAALTEEG